MEKNLINNHWLLTMAESRLTRIWSSNIGEWDEYWDDILDVHGYWWSATEDPKNAEYTLEELENTRFTVPNIIDWLIDLVNEGFVIVGLASNKVIGRDPTDTTSREMVEITRVTVNLEERTKG